MAPKKKPCIEEGCDYSKYATYHRCYWHWLLQQPPDKQVLHADKRLQRYRASGLADVPRVPEKDWPEGQRWCAGCQSFVPLFYVTGSRCKACASRASHASHIKRTYDLSEEDYRALLAWQGGRCFICGRLPRSRRLAVDHDHITGRVRGLLCADDERGCNHAILGNLEASAGPGNILDAARRLVAYLERSPIERMRAGESGIRIVPPRIGTLDHLRAWPQRQ